MNGIIPKLVFISIRKNKIRTLSTALGITLAVMLMTVVVIIATSISASIIVGASEKYGSWHVMSEEITQQQFDNMQSDKMIDSVCYVCNFGYMQIDSPVDSAKPYIHIADVSSAFPEYLSCEVISGRMPQNGNEIVISSQFFADYPESELNSVIEFTVGQRTSAVTGGILWQNSSYLGAEKEYIQSSGKTVRYTIVGVVENVESIDYKFSPGYTFLTCGIDSIQENTKVYIKLNNLSSNLSKLENYLSEDKIIYNTNLLNYLGVSGGENLQGILNSIVSVLIVIIGAAAFVLINNSLMTSSDERSKQFGVLNSIGMTRSQTAFMFMTEVFVTGIISVIAGMAIGSIFAYLSFNAIGNLIAKTSYLNLSLTVSVNIAYMIIVAVVAVAILLVAALYNALLQMRGTAIGKLRKTAEIKKPKNKKQGICKSNIAIEWNIVWNSFLRYNKKYRYVIISLSLSAVLFVSAGLFGKYADNYIKEIMPTAGYDITVISRGYSMFETVETQYNSLSVLDEVTDSGWLCSVDAGFILFDDFNLNEDVKTYAENRNISKTEITYIFISDESYLALSDGNLSDVLYIYDNLTYYFNGEQLTSKLFQSDSASFTLFYMNDAQRSAYYESDDLTGNSTQIAVTTYRIADNNLPIELESITESNGIFLIIPIGRLYEFTEDLPSGLRMYFAAADHTSAVEKMIQIGEENGWNLSVTDVAESFEKEKSTYAMYEIFAMIFTVLISLVAIINAFNAVSANLLKRKREFAVLQSIGLSNKSFYKIIFYECLLLCGIVIAVTLLFTPIISAVLSFSFPVTAYAYIFPWEHLCNAIICLFIVFAASMFKPIFTIKRQNIIETIKGDSD